MTGQESIGPQGVLARQLSALDCPLCKSIQVEICVDSNNPIKNMARCRTCKCTAPLFAWNNLVMRES